MTQVRTTAQNAKPTRRPADSEHGKGGTSKGAQRQVGEVANDRWIIVICRVRLELRL